MKKIKLLLFSLTCLFIQALTNSASAAVQPLPRIGQVRLSDMVKLTPNDFRVLTKNKLNLAEKISFNVTKSRMKNYLRHHGDITLGEYLKIEEKEKGKINWFWFCLGALSPIVGKLIIYLITDETSAAIWLPLILLPVIIAFATKQDKRNKKSVLLGAGILLVVGLLAALINSNAY